MDSTTDYVIGSTASLDAASTAAAAPADQSPSTWSFVVTYTTTIAMAVCSIVGNSLVIAAFRSSPSLWTKCNRILSSLAVAQILIAVNVLLGFVYELVAYIFGDPCNYAAVDAVVRAMRLVPSQVSVDHLVVVGIDRYVAILRPTFYEERLTDRVVNWMIFVAWAVGCLLALSNALWALTADRIPCGDSRPQVIPAWYTSVFGTGLYMAISVCLVAVYSRLLYIIWRHRVSVGIETAKTVKQRVRRPKQAFGTTSTNAATDEAARKEKREQAKDRKRQFQAVYLTAAMVVCFVLLWFPYALSCLLAACGLKVDLSSALADATGAIGTFNLSFNWVLCIIFSKPVKRSIKRILFKRKDKSAKGFVAALLPSCFCLGSDKTPVTPFTKPDDEERREELDKEEEEEKRRGDDAAGHDNAAATDDIDEMHSEKRDASDAGAERDADAAAGDAGEEGDAKPRSRASSVCSSHSADSVSIRDSEIDDYIESIEAVEGDGEG